MSSPNWMAKSNNYFLCRLCRKVLRMSRYAQEPHCGELPRQLTDREARSLVEGKKKGARMKSVMARRGQNDLDRAERQARYNRMFRHSTKAKVQR